ncbi:MAG: double zinc ribbon domain-containing protein [Verrucomicrobiota bacterium]
MLAAPISHCVEAGLAWLYPRICQLCEVERATPEEGFVCRKCWTGVRFIKPPFCERCGLPYEGDITGPFECSNCREMELYFSAARSAVAAKGVTLEIIHRFKYQRALWFEPFLVDLLRRAALPVVRGQRWDLIVPVPLHHAKQREREFNQAERLAAGLAQMLQLPVREDLYAASCPRVPRRN